MMQASPQPFILCLMGPTGSGKTALAVELVQRFPCEIISVDSAMVYRGLDIGTAKPSAPLLRIAPHRLLDCRDPADSYSAGDFQIEALREIQDILNRNKIPLLVGGTMLYFHILHYGLDPLPEQDRLIRSQLQQEARQIGWTALHERLASIDPQAAKRIHPHDSQRIQRALEVYTLTGKPLTEQQVLQAEQTVLPYPLHSLILNPGDRQSLHQGIEKRFLTMLEQGFLEEVKHLYQRGDLSLENPAIRSVGYRQAWEYLSGELSFEAMKEKAIIATRQLAKRQLTWLRRFKEAKCFDSEAKDLREQVSNYLQPFFFSE